jgi:hypothetical protein
MAAAATLETLGLDAVTDAQLRAVVFEAAIRMLQTDARGDCTGRKCLESTFCRTGTSASVSRRLAYRTLARHAPSKAERIAWVDAANQARPRTLT